MDQSLSEKLQENPKHISSFYSNNSKTKRIPETVIYGDTRSRDVNSKVKLFNVFFQSVYSKSTTDVNLATVVVNPNLLFETITTAPELEGILSRINCDDKVFSLANWKTKSSRTEQQQLGEITL